MKRAVAFVGADLSAAGPEGRAPLDVPSICVKFAFLFHDADITSSSAESVDLLLLGALHIHRRGCSRGDHNRGVIPLLASTSIMLTQDARTVFIVEPLADGLSTETPAGCPIPDREMPLFKGLRAGTELTLSVIRRSGFG